MYKMKMIIHLEYPLYKMHWAQVFWVWVLLSILQYLHMYDATS